MLQSEVHCCTAQGVSFCNSCKLHVGQLVTAWQQLKPGCHQTMLHQATGHTNSQLRGLLGDS